MVQSDGYEADDGVLSGVVPLDDFNVQVRAGRNPALPGQDFILVGYIEWNSHTYGLLSSFFFGKPKEFVNRNVQAISLCSAREPWIVLT